MDCTYLQPRTSVAAQARTYVKLRVGTRASTISFLSCVRAAMTGQGIGVSYVYANATAGAQTSAAVVERAAIACAKNREYDSRALAGKSPITAR